MLSIRSEQLRALAKDNQQRHDEGLVADLRRALSGAVRPASSDADLEALARDGRRRALLHGIVERGDLLRFLALQLSLGRAFDEERAWAAEILRRPGTLTERLAALEARAAGEG